ncbi:hypothetical protein SESBI_12407 [Sesbania bispinosa]|nr:hypothetical protein SESBI_12407 [Sesbania bispinosa]
MKNESRTNGEGDRERTENGRTRRMATQHEHDGGGRRTNATEATAKEEGRQMRDGEEADARQRGWRRNTNAMEAGAARTRRRRLRRKRGG